MVGNTTPGGRARCTRSHRITDPRAAASGAGHATALCSGPRVGHEAIRALHQRAHTHRRGQARFIRYRRNCVALFLKHCAPSLLRSPCTLQSLSLPIISMFTVQAKRSFAGTTLLRTTYGFPRGCLSSGSSHWQPHLDEAMNSSLSTANRAFENGRVAKRRAAQRGRSAP